MVFAEKLYPDTQNAALYLGYAGAVPDATTKAALQSAAERIADASAARWCWKYIEPDTQNAVACKGISLAGACLTGQDIQQHLAGCHGVALLAVTLGAGADTLLRTATATDMREAVLLDACASQLVEQYADAATELVRRQLGQKGLHITPRFSPGYGDLPLDIQPGLCALLDTHRAIGLTVSESGLLTPRKSITAILGVANTPVAGRLVACEGCKLYSECERRLGGNPCGKRDF